MTLHSIASALFHQWPELADRRLAPHRAAETVPSVEVRAWSGVVLCLGQCSPRLDGILQGLEPFSRIAAKAREQIGVKSHASHFGLA